MSVHYTEQVRTMQVKKDNSDRKQIRFGKLLDDINNARGGDTFAGWVKSACRDKLDKEKEA